LTNKEKSKQIGLQIINNNQTLKTMNKLITLQLLRNIAYVDYRYGRVTLGEVDQAEANLSIYLNKN
jgi:hypothetical protein